MAGETGDLRAAARALARLAPLAALFVGVTLLLGSGTSPAGDEGPFLGVAQRLLHGQYAAPHTTDATAFLWHGPGLPALLAPLVALGLPLPVLRLVGPLALFAAVVLFYRLLALRLTTRGALIGAYALGLYAPFYELLGSLHKEPLAILLAVALLYATARYLRDKRHRHLVLGGLAFAALAMTRLEYGYVIAVLLALSATWWLWLRARARPDGAAVAARCAAICAVAMVACLPWLAYTYAVTAHVFYWGNAGGLSLYWMSSPDPRQLGEWHAVHTVYADPRLAAYRPFFDHLATLSPLRRDLLLRQVAVHQIFAHPAKYALNLLANGSRMVVAFPFSFELPAPALAAYVAFSGALLGALAFAAGRLRRARRAVAPETAPFVAFAVTAIAVHLVPSSEPRMLYPLVPVALWLIAQAANRRAGRRRRVTLAA